MTGAHLVNNSAFETLNRAEQFARSHDNIKLANELYGLGCTLGGPAEMPPFKLTPEHVAATAEIARRRATGDYPVVAVRRSRHAERAS